jgi:archaellum component FlaG (FlaF/FlaG flagellin family)
MKLVLPVTIVLGVLTSACHKEAEAPSSTIEADFELLNTQGQSATSFRQGQNIVFRFRVKNNTSDDVLLTNPLFETTHFLEVSKLSADNTSTVIGKPYKYVFCS